MAKSQRKFSLIAIDHGHEQNNGVMKDEGGVIGLTQDAEALVRWAVAGPELVHVISEFQSSMVGKKESASQRNHHEQTNATQKLFASQVNTLVRVIEGMGSPFEEESQDLLRLHSKDIMEKQSTECLATIQSKGQEQYGTFVDECLRSNMKPITATITRNKVILFNEQARKSNKAETQVSLLKSESSLFARLYVHARQEMEIWTISLATKIIHFHHPFLPMDNYVWEKSRILWTVLNNM